MRKTYFEEFEDELLIACDCQKGSWGEEAHPFYFSQLNGHISVQSLAQNRNPGSYRGNSAKEKCDGAVSSCPWASKADQTEQPGEIQNPFHAMNLVGELCVRHPGASLQHMTLYLFLVGPCISIPA